MYKYTACTEKQKLHNTIIKIVVTILIYLNALNT